jgi:hypothetical protein
MTLKSALFPLATGTVLLALAVAFGRQILAGSPAENRSVESAWLTDEPLEHYRAELLELAFESATAMPIEPHIKNRSRAQEAVVVACLELEQPRRALASVDKIANWRRAAGYADLAFYAAQHGLPDVAEHFVGLAHQWSEDSEDEDAQDWHKDRVRVRIAQTYAWLRQPDRAAPFEAGLVESESGKLSSVKAQLLDAEAFEQQIEALESVVATGTFDQVRNALSACAQLYGRFYADKTLRSRCEDLIKASWEKLPILVRIELLMELAGFALDHGDQGSALELVGEARGIAQSVQWIPEDEIALQARLAELRYRAGDASAARSEADGALAKFEAERDKIVDIYRAGALRALAETYLSMGDTQVALEVYGRAVEEGVANPNSRPRAQDLSATCLSMALHGFEPSAELRARLREIRDGLGAPW